jgi:hypothetical protein
MSSDIQLIATSPLVNKMVLAVIKTFRLRNIKKPTAVIHADLVPRVSEKVMQASLKEKIVSPKTNEMTPSLIPKMEELIKPIKVHLPQRRPTPRAILPPPKSPKPIQRTVQVPSNVSPHLDGEYGKLDGLFNDPSISSIECPGPGKPFLIIRAGQRQFTRVTMSPKEIKEFLEKIADEAKIPLIEGVFRAAVHDFSINAVISEIIGSRFVIKKQTPYSMLEPPRQP